MLGAARGLRGRRRGRPGVLGDLRGVHRPGAAPPRPGPGGHRAAGSALPGGPVLRAPARRGGPDRGRGGPAPAAP